MLSRCRPVCRSLGHLKRLHRFQINHENPYIGLLVAFRYASNDKLSKVEQTLRNAQEELKRKYEEEKMSPVISTAPKPPILTRIKHELVHYWHGFRLFFLEVRISSRYLMRLLRGESITRRERQQLVRSFADIFRVVPFMGFIIVPFAEFLLPFYLKFFPGALPSTFEDASKKVEKLRKLAKAKTEFARFLQESIEEAPWSSTKLDKKDAKNSKAAEFAEFVKNVRTQGSYVMTEDILKFAKLFEDELTLDSLAIGQLRALCKVLGIQVLPLASPEIMRFQLRLKLRELKADDRLIVEEGGVEALSIVELQEACRNRGMRAYGVSEDRLRIQLKQWLEMSLDDKIPPSLLLLSRVFYLPEDIPFADRMKAIISQLPEGLAEQTRQQLTEIEGGKVGYKDRLELLQSIEKQLADERQLADKITAAKKEKEKSDAGGAKADKEKEDKSFEKVLEGVELRAHAIKEHAADLVDAQKISPETAKEIVTPVERVLDTTSKAKEARLHEIVDKNLLTSLEDVLHGSPIDEVKHDVAELKEKFMEHTEDLIALGNLSEEFKEPKGVKHLRSRVNSMISGIDGLVAKLENERRHVTEVIADPAVPKAAEQKKERLVYVSDLLYTLQKLQKITDETKKKKLEEVLKAMDTDTDGKVEAGLVLEVLEILNNQPDVEITSKQMASILEMLKKEDVLEELEKMTETENLEKLLAPMRPAPNLGVDEKNRINEEEIKLKEEEVLKDDVLEGMDIKLKIPPEELAKANEQPKTPPSPR